MSCKLMANGLIVEFKLTKYEIQYSLYKVEGNTSGLFDDLFKDCSKLKEQAKYYYENDMGKDLEFLKKEAE